MKLSRLSTILIILLFAASLFTGSYELYTSGTISGITILPLGLLILISLGELCKNKEDKREKSEFQKNNAIHKIRFEVELKGSGWEHL